MKKKKVNVLFTCAGSKVAPAIVEMIKRSSRYKVAVLGTDAGEKRDLAGRYFCDKFRTVPAAYERGYIPEMLDICRSQRISTVFPGSDEEAFILSRHRDRFLSINTKIACSSMRSIEKSLDKLRLMEYLKENKVCVGGFYGLDNIDDIKKYSTKLGYPKEKIVIKPRTARGSKGFRILTNDVSSYERFSSNKFYFTTLKEVIEAFKGHDKEIKGFFVMEYFKGPRYSVDILMECGRPVSAICRKKIFPIDSPTQLADIVFDSDIIAYAKKVASLIGFDYFVQIEIGRDRKGHPSVIEINPRIDATLPIVEGLGINYFEEMISYALENTFRKKYFEPRKRHLRFYRYWNHIFKKHEKDND